MEKIEEFIREYPEHGYRSLAQFAEDAVRRRADELRVFELTPRFTHFNILSDHATIQDKKTRRWVNVYPKEPGELWCEYCDSTDCVHVKFALTVPEIKKALKKKRWKYRGE